MTRLVADEVAKSRTPYPYIDGLIFQITQNAGAVRVRHVGRGQGQSGYTLRKLVRLWMSMLVNFSVLPLRLMTFAGMITSALGFLAVIEVVLEHLLKKNPTGWSSLMAAILLLSGTQLLLLGIMGEYVGRIYLGISEKPQSVVRTKFTSSGKSTLIDPTNRELIRSLWSSKLDVGRWALDVSPQIGGRCLCHSVLCS